MYCSLPRDMTELPESTFDNCVRLETVDMPPKIQMIGDFAFSSCIKVRLDIGKTCRYIGKYAFNHCESLRVMDLAEGCTISLRAFAYSKIERLILRGDGFESNGKAQFIGADIDVFDLRNTSADMEKTGAWIDAFAGSHIEKLICDEKLREKLIKALRELNANVES